MSENNSSPRYGRCRHCGCAIINRSGKRNQWYHVEQNTTGTVPGHFAEPHSVMDREATS